MEGYFPRWAKEITQKAPDNRTEKEVDSMMKILKLLNAFRRYSPGTQRLLCKAVRYNRFERHRVIIRKGHVGRRFYVIYSGSVAFTFNEDDAEVFSKQPGYYTMGKGDAFGELSLIRNAQRSATIVCLTTTELLYIEKEDFSLMGIDNILRNEMEYRVKYFRLENVRAYILFY
ncbi:cyclic nucleotide-binding domain-containing protein 2-like [Xenia sp. Carnegie-2017]|uniref:cyclic nucleotide-binding domain-containing protein 2-like n=1 Tax=Xenia sp. Carnegie-2017 TaxID=2897299 RepID=UPI001F03C06F|nr:cyclic nucleotide-binding domain-containing protein 2-like [Xenia sp. Carnegie-2017]